MDAEIAQPAPVPDSPSQQTIRAEFHQPTVAWGSGNDRWHEHPHCELMLVVCGTYRADTPEGPLSLDPGQAVCFAAGRRHRPRYLLDGTVQFYYLRFPPQAGMADLPLTVVDRSQRLRLALWWLWQLAQQDDGPSEAARQSLLDLALFEYRRAGAGTDLAASADPVQTITHYLLQNLAYSHRVGELARLVQLSAPHLTRLCVRATGMPPHRYLQHLRLERAHQLLVTTRDPVAEIGRQVGITDPAHLSRLMKRHTGFSPSELRGGTG